MTHNHTAISAMLGHRMSIAERDGQGSRDNSRELAMRARARARVFERLLDAEAHADGLRLDAFREYLGTTIRQVSPVLMDLCRHELLDLDAITFRLRPADAWPAWFCGRTPRSNLYWARGHGLWGSWVPSAQLIEADWRLFLTSALIVRDRDDPAGVVAVRPLGACLEVGAQLGTALLRTEAGEAELILGETMPDTLRIALPGMKLDAVFDHPALRGRGYTIESATERRDGTTIVTFRCQPVSWSLPWARS